MTKLNSRQELILSFLSPNQQLTPKEISSKITPSVSTVTISRDLSELVQLEFLNRFGIGPATKYALNHKALLLRPIDSEKYFSVDTDHRQIFSSFNFEIFDIISKSSIFDQKTQNELDQLQSAFSSNYKKLSPTIIKKEIERVTIELSWKSSVIEGNTYTLLDTENLLKEGIEAKGKQKNESIMLINHKQAIDYIFNNPSEFQKISLQKIEDLHKVITKNLNISPNLRKTLVGITGTKYQPLDNQFQIRESVEKMCKLINSLDNVFSKSLLSIILISYIQPFEDGNKRTSRILGNALLLAHNYFPLPLRSVDENLYKQATLLFYEQNNLQLFIKMFIDQCHFSVNNYFRT